MLKDLYPIDLFCDNLAAQACAKTDGGNRLRHMINRREHYIKDCVKRNLINIIWVRSKDQIADIFTKPLGRDQHANLTDSILNSSP